MWLCFTLQNMTLVFKFIRFWEFWIRIHHTSVPSRWLPGYPRIWAWTCLFLSVIPIIWHLTWRWSDICWFCSRLLAWKVRFWKLWWLTLLNIQWLWRRRKLILITFINYIGIVIPASSNKLFWILFESAEKFRNFYLWLLLLFCHTLFFKSSLTINLCLLSCDNVIFLCLTHLCFLLSLFSELFGTFHLFSTLLCPICSLITGLSSAHRAVPHFDLNYYTYIWL